MRPCRIFLTGEPGCGKTTVIRKIHEMLTARGMKAAGIASGEIREHGTRVGFTLEDLSSHETGILAHVALKEGPALGKYHVNLNDIERIAVAAIKCAIARADVIIVDEVGPMELNSRQFVLAIQSALIAPKHFVGTIHKRASHPLIAEIKSTPTYQILEVTSNNRDALPRAIIERIESRA
jgi:nucleoside-triphosphatase